MSIKQNISILYEQFVNFPPKAEQIERLYSAWQEDNPGKEILLPPSQSILSYANGNGSGRSSITYIVYITLVHT